MSSLEWKDTTTAAAIDVAIALRYEVTYGYLTYPCARQMAFVWGIDGDTDKLKCRIFGADENGEYSKGFRKNREDYVQCDPIDAFEKYGYALDIRVGHHAPMWTNHIHLGSTELLDSLHNTSAVRRTRRQYDGKKVKPRL